MVARRAHNPKVGGSNPSPATKLSCLKTAFFMFNIRLLNDWIPAFAGMTKSSTYISYCIILC